MGDRNNEIKQGTGGFLLVLHLVCLENMFDFRELIVVSCGLQLIYFVKLFLVVVV